MIEAVVLDSEFFQTTDGEIAVVNLNSARLRSWSRFYQDPQQAGAAEIVLEHEQLTAQFASDLSALDRMEAFADRLGQSLTRLITENSAAWHFATLATQFFGRAAPAT